jgi:hypothetical protein
LAAVPAGRVAHVLARLLYDRPDAEATAILRACRWSMAPGARRWIVEEMVVPGDAYARAKLLDLLILCMFGAQERTEGECRALLAATGFAWVVVHLTATPWSVVKAVRG